MSISSELREKYLSRIGELVTEGEAIKDDATLERGDTSENWITGRVRRSPDFYTVDRGRFFKWKANCISLLDAIVPHSHLHRSTIQTFQKRVSGYTSLDWAIGVLKGIGEDFDLNLLAAAVSEIEFQVSCAYMDQAKALLQTQGILNSNITAAAVLTGISLERRLRTLWEEKNRPEAAPDQPKRLGGLIDDLKKVNAISEAKAKQLRAWADIRNHAAHGEYDQFSVNELKQMIDGVGNFLRELK